MPRLFGKAKDNNKYVPSPSLVGRINQNSGQLEGVLRAQSTSLGASLGRHEVLEFKALGCLQPLGDSLVTIPNFQVQSLELKVEIIGHGEAFLSPACSPRRRPSLLFLCSGVSSNAPGNLRYSIQRRQCSISTIATLSGILIGCPFLPSACSTPLCLLPLLLTCSWQIAAS